MAIVNSGNKIRRCPVPVYASLRIKSSDSPGIAAWKRHVAERLVALRSALRDHIYRYRTAERSTHERDDHRWLRLATWNIREFDSGRYGGRLGESFYYIAEIISHFDLVALQEVREDLRALKRVLNILGEHEWSFLATDVTEGRPGNRERMVFVYNTRRVRFTNVAGELTLPENSRITRSYHNCIEVPDGLRLDLPVGSLPALPDHVKTRKYRGIVRLSEDIVLDIPSAAKMVLPGGCRLVLKKGMVVTREGKGVHIEGMHPSAPLFGKDALVMFPDDLVHNEGLQFARTPFLVTFQAGWLKFLLCTVHIYYGSGSEGLLMRNQEIRRLTEELAGRARSENDSDSDNVFLLLGDFNIIGKKHDTWDALHSNGFSVPEALSSIPEGSNVRRDKAYDQIAYWQSGKRRRDCVTDIDTGNAGIFDFFRYVFREGRDDPGGCDEARYADRAGASGVSYRSWRTYQMSDHLPMWLEIRTDFSDEYLADITES